MLPPLYGALGASEGRLLTMLGLSSLTNLKIQSSGTKHPSLDSFPADDVKCHLGLLTALGNAFDFEYHPD